MSLLALRSLYRLVGTAVNLYQMFGMDFQSPATMGAVASIPSVYFRVARDYGFSNSKILTHVMLPAIAPQVITSLRVTAGLAWLVVVAAEMIAGRAGLGFAIWDARNGLRMDLLVCGMIVIGLIGVVIDRILVQLTKIPSVRWGYER